MQIAYLSGMTRGMQKYHKNMITHIILVKIIHQNIFIIILMNVSMTCYQQYYNINAPRQCTHINPIKWGEIFPPRLFSGSLFHLSLSLFELPLSLPSRERSKRLSLSLSLSFPSPSLAHATAASASCHRLPPPAEARRPRCLPPPPPAAPPPLATAGSTSSGSLSLSSVVQPGPLPPAKVIAPLRPPLKSCRRAAGGDGERGRKISSSKSPGQRFARDRRGTEDRLRRFRYRYRIPVSVAVTVSGTVKVLNGTRYLRYPIPTSRCRYRLLDVGIGFRYHHPIPTSANG